MRLLSEYMEALPQGISPRPSLTGWALAFLSLVLALSVGSAALFVGAHERRAVLVSQLERALSVRDYAQADSALEDLDSPPLPLRIESVLSTKSTLEAHGALQTARTLVHVLSAFSTQRLDEAQARLASVPAAYDSLVQGLQPKLSSVADIQKQLSDTRQSLVTLDQKLDEISQQGELIAREFAEMLSLELEESDSALPNAYERGVLVGLPRIEGLRDNIVDLTFLKVELDGLHARVRVEGDDQHAAFTAKLEQLRGSYQEVLRQYGEVETDFARGEEQIEETARQLRFAQLKVEQDLRQEIRSIIKPLVSAKNT
jgi:archaellum component FlaC